MARGGRSSVATQEETTASPIPAANQSRTEGSVLSCMTSIPRTSPPTRQARATATSVARPSASARHWPSRPAAPRIASA